jgi:hypothetical protein
MRLLLSITAVVEGIVGVGLLITPVLTISILLNTQLEVPGGLFAARLCGAAILTLSICCWKARVFKSHEAAIGIVTAMLFYNVSAAAVLTYARLGSDLHSAFIWPALVAHVTLGVWCATLIWFSIRTNQLSQKS